jgi:3D (Asp-Asp-Asp) domain-containing protein
VVGDVTMYCLSGTMADGQPVHSGAVATLDRSIPFGAHVVIPGLGTFTVEDRIGYGSNFDVWTASCATAIGWGRHTLNVTISR